MSMPTQGQSDDVKAGLERIREVFEWVDRKLPELEIKGDHRHRIPAQLYDLALEHAASILHLIEVRHHASAFALVRCEFECFVRAAWIHHCATADEIKQFVEKDEIRPSIGQLIEALEQLPIFEDKLLSNVKEKAWTSMNGYTHGGIHQVCRRLVDNYIEPAFEDQSLLEVMQFAGVMGLIAFGEVAQMAKRNDIVAEAQALMDRGAAHVVPPDRPKNITFA
jgi:hypothetical protein